MDFSEVIKVIRQELNLSQEQLAREIHVSFATINRWEKGKNCPNMLTRKVLYEFCKTKGLNEELIDGLL